MLPPLGPTWAPQVAPDIAQEPPECSQGGPGRSRDTVWGRSLDRFWLSLEHLLADMLGWSYANAFAENLVEPLLANDPAQSLCSIQPLRHRAECGACHLGYEALIGKLINIDEILHENL